MNKEELRTYLSSRYGGYKSFLEKVIFPIFGNENFEDGYGAEYLSSSDANRKLAGDTGITSMKKVGSFYISGEPLVLYDITVSDRVLMARNRVNIQRLVHQLMDTYSCAFLIFHYANDELWDWRFSYCHKGKDRNEFTDSKRFTFLLGPGQLCKTATDNFAKLLEKGKDIKVSDIEDAFSVEALSKEFFERYKEHYSEFVAYMCNTPEIYDEFAQELEVVNDADTGKAIRDFVKRQLGRIVFLHFLQKKGWLGVEEGKEWGTGDKQFMQHLFEKASGSQKDNFLSSVLVPLYRDALDTDRSGNNDLFDTGVEGIGVVRVPYLNGGLFECGVLDAHEWKLPKELFANLLEMFSQYNFTIDENDPDDAEVGVDPEMLGRIFENLLEDNKDKGAYYTPKEIVRYMCRESLIAYLQTDLEEVDKEKVRKFVMGYDAEVLGELKETIDQKLKDVKICDPAIGSGAFPMGLLRELFFCRTSLEPEIVCNAAEIKREIIQNNIYGVDIEYGAVEIARLRFWLSLVVDEKSPCALPNLDYKIMQGNSLVERYMGVPLQDITKVGSSTGELIYGEEVCDDKFLKNRLYKYFSTFEHNERQHLLDEMEEAIKKLIIAYDPNLEEALKHITVHANSSFFLWHTWFLDVFEKGGFDIVIGNPPYIKEYTNRKAFDVFRETSPYYMGKMDLWYGFACYGLDLAVNEGGILCFIAQNNWTTSKGARLFRNKIVKDCRILKMIDFNNYMVFGESASIQTMVMLFINDNSTDDYTIDYRSLKSNAEKKDMLDLLEHKETEKTNYLTPIFNRKFYEEKYFTFSGVDNILNKIDDNKVFFYDKEITQGIVFPQETLNKEGQKRLGHNKVGDGIFSLTSAELNNLNIPVNEMSLIRPFYTTEQIKRYYVEPNSNVLWVIYTNSSYKDKSKMNNYPILKKHLDNFLPIFTSDNKPYGLHRARKEDFFKGEKLLSLRKCTQRPSFSYSNFDCYVSQTFFVIQTSRWDMKFLTGVLNSRLIAFWLKHRGKMQGENYQIDKEPLLSIPLPLPRVEQKEIIEQVDIILNKLSKEQNADISIEEDRINQLVYNIYNLSLSDINTIENSL